MLKNKKIVIGITGSIAAYKMPLVVRLLMKEGAEVRVIMTPAAVDFVTPLTLSTLSRASVIIEPFHKGSGEWNNHVELGMWADAMLFAPVTANTLGKMVNGIADNFLVTAYLSAKCPVFIAPAMDLDMYNHPSTNRNISILKSIGNILIEPQTGELASGLSGPGRMEEPERMVKILESFFKKRNDLAGKKVLITSGPTQESIDPVRYISNHSSGKMGSAIADEAASRGASVTLVTGPASVLPKNPGIKMIQVTTAIEMMDACLKTFSGADITIMAAAVADYSPAKVQRHKIKKETQDFSVILKPTPDILERLGTLKKSKQILVGFALESENEIRNATQKLTAKNLDLVVLNSLRDKGAGFGTETNKVTIIDRFGSKIKGGLKEKREVAADILDAVSSLLQKRL